MKLTKKRIQEILSQYEPGANVYVSVSHEDIKALCNLALEGMKTITRLVSSHRKSKHPVKFKTSLNRDEPNTSQVKAKSPRGKSKPVKSSPVAK